MKKPVLVEDRDIIMAAHKGGVPKYEHKRLVQHVRRQARLHGRDATHDDVTEAVTSWVRAREAAKGGA